MKLHHALLLTGLSLLAMALYRLLVSDPTPESPFMSEWRMAMEEARLYPTECRLHGRNQ